MKFFFSFNILIIFGIIQANGYDYGKLYNYAYHGYIYSGFSELKPQRSGVTFDSRVTLYRSHDYYIFQLKSVKFERFNADIENFEDNRHDFRYYSSSEKYLRKPFKVYFNDNRIQHFEASSDEDVWSINIKKGLLALFNLNLQKYGEDRRHFNIRSIHSDYNYEVYEDGIGGECETFYNIQTQPYYGKPYENNVLNVTKVKNYHKCRSDPVRSYVSHEGYRCVQCEVAQTHPFHANSRYYYNIRGNRHHYVIEKVISNGEFLYSPYTTQGQTVYVRLNRTLELIDEREDSSTRKTYTIKNDVRYTSLAYEHEKRKEEYKLFDLKNAHYLYDVYGYHVSVQNVEKLLHELTEYEDDDDSNEDYKSRNIPRKFVELVRGLATLDYRRLEDVYKYVKDDIHKEYDSNNSKILELFINALTVTGTNPSFAIAKYLFESEEIQPKLIEYYLTTAPFHFKQLTEVLLREFYELCEHPYIRGHYNLRSVCYLAFAGLIHQACVTGKTTHASIKHEYCNPEKASKYFNYIIPNQRFERTIDQLMYIKTAGNFGLKETIEYVKPYVSKDGHQPLFFRVSALWALSRVVHYYSDEVLQLVAPLYFDSSEDYEVRIIAFTLILISKSPTYILETIANSLYHEPSDQVKSYVYSTFYYLANSTHPCHKKISEKSSFFLNQLKSLKYDLHLDLDHSFNYFSSGYEAKYDYGGLTKVAYIPSNSSYIPRSVYVMFNDYFGGESHNSVSFGYHAYGLEKYFDKIFGPKGPFKDSSFFESFGNRKPRDVNTVDKELREIYKKINLETREYEPVYGDIFIKHQGTQISFFHFNESFINEILSGNNTPTQNKSNHFPTDRHLLGTDRTYVIPTDIGFPLVFSIMQPLYLHYNMKNFSYETVKKGAFPTETKVHIDGHLKYDHELYATLEVVIPYEHVTHGAGVFRRSIISLPVKLNATVNYERSKLSFRHTPFESHNVYHLEFEPFTFTNDYNDHSSNYVRDKTPLYEEYRHHNEHKFINNFLGISAKTKVAYNNIWNDYGSWYDFLTKTDFRQKFYYYFGNPNFNPYNFDLFIEKIPEDQINELEAVFKYDYYGLGAKDDRNSESKQLEALEDYGITGSDREWYTHTISGEFYAKDQHERHIKTEVTYSYSRDNLLHKYFLFYDRAPSQSTEKNHVQVCLSGILNFPKYDSKSFYDLKTQNLQHAVNTTLNIYFGSDCKSDKKITIKGHFDRTEEQKQYEARREEPVTHERFNEYAYYYQKCLEERQRGYYYNPYCKYYLFIITELRHYNIEVNYQNLPESFKNTTYKLASCFRHRYYNNIDRDVYAKNPDGQIRVEFNVSIHDPVADIHVHEPHETLHYNHVYLSGFYPIRTYPSFYYSNLREYIKTYNYPSCLVQKDQVRTFDNVTYTLPSTDCYKVIAKDCSPTQRFIVLGKKITHPRYEKAVKIFFDKYKVEALPVSDESDLIVRVNGKRITVIENEPYYHYVTVNEKQSLLFSISYKNFYYTFHSHAYGLYIGYNGKSIFVQISPNQKGKQCGLCGDYNGDKQNEFRGPEGCIYHDNSNFGYSYTIPEENCAVPKHYSPCRVESHDCIRRYTHYVELENDVCFSVTPIAKCEETCKPKGSVRTTVHFHCLKSTDRSTNHLKQESEYRILEEISNKSKDYSQEIEYPESCIPSEH